MPTESPADEPAGILEVSRKRVDESLAAWSQANKASAGGEAQASPELAKARAQVAEATAKITALQEERAASSISAALTARGVDSSHHAKAIALVRKVAQKWEVDEDGGLYVVDSEGKKHFSPDHVAEHILAEFPKLWGSATRPKAGGAAPDGRPLHELSDTELMKLSRVRRESGAQGARERATSAAEQAIERQRILQGRELHELSDTELMKLSRLRRG